MERKGKAAIIISDILNDNEDDEVEVSGTVRQ